ncbi:tyrosine-protein phosphatase non-receptor type 9-like [Cydia pomonella]|uniref:tyrosine-protein phosphatase non-receptor type 9-like n=1 Tax=Cydia pomonella TaxID=82600 RepID=UPI002ADE75A6|nr:tyrosine-protein phosphatase non-receptor type 9-like [Cydia pomonella]
MQPYKCVTISIKFSFDTDFSLKQGLLSHESKFKKMGGIFTKKQSSVSYHEERIIKILEQEHQRILHERIYHSCSISVQPENIVKNRYRFSPCFDYNRVILPADNGESDYINANHVNGYKTRGKYLCCQGPLPSTAEDFYKMVFGYQSRVIVMLTKTHEEGQEVCYQYWSPKKGNTVFFGDFTIETRQVKTYRDHIVTKLRVTDDSEDSLDITHFAYTDWPFKSVPRSPTDFLNFVLKVRKAQAYAEFDNKSSNFPPMVVHCSAGLNRTGTFCAVDISISRYNESATIDLGTVVKDLRKQRNNCLSLPVHYIFCYLTILEYVKLASKKA